MRDCSFRPAHVNAHVGFGEAPVLRRHLERFSRAAVLAERLNRDARDRTRAIVPLLRLALDGNVGERNGAFVTKIAPGNVQVLFPEGNVLLPSGKREPQSLVPDYTAIVEIVRSP